MSEPINSSQNSNSSEPSAPQAQPSQPKATWPKNTVRNLLYVISLMGLVSLLFWLLLPPNPPATLAQVTPVATATAGGWEVPITSTVVPTQTVVPVITPTRTPWVIGIIATLILPPSPEPPPTATPTFERIPLNPDGSVTVGGYTFSQPQKVTLSANLKNSLDFRGWLPDNPDEIIANTNEGRIVGINVYSGQVHYFSHPTANSISYTDMKLLKGNQVLFQTSNPTTQQSSDMWLSQADDQQATQPIFQEVNYNPILMPDKQSILLYERYTLDIKLLNSSGQLEIPDEKYRQFLTPLKITTEDKEYYRSTANPDGSWIAFENLDQLMLLNWLTGENKTVPLPPLLRTSFLEWSPDGQKITIIAFNKYAQLVNSTQLFVFEVGNEKLVQLGAQFDDITNVTWASDSQHLLFSAETGTRTTAHGEANTSDLFLIDIRSNKFQLVPLFPQDNYLGFFSKLSWSPDGNKVMLSGFLKGNTSLLHRIDVTK